MNTEKYNNNHKYHCCFCRNFQLEGYRWGYCKLLDVYVKGNLDACQASIEPFTSTDNKTNNIDTKK